MALLNTCGLPRQWVRIAQYSGLRLLINYYFSHYRWLVLIHYIIIIISLDTLKRCVHYNFNEVFTFLFFSPYVDCRCNQNRRISTICMKCLKSFKVWRFPVRKMTISTIILLLSHLSKQNCCL